MAVSTALQDKATRSVPSAAHRPTTEQRAAVPLASKHRDDIDGLRALAILPVVLFHLKTPFAYGGFLGVDIFFVISGYLIAGIVEADLAADRFSIRRFYERRALRIFPALFAMLAVCALVGWFALLPQEFADLGRAIVATTVFTSNIFFYAKANYFSAGSTFEPLLHTWSLAVEEQFYLIFPLLLMLLHHWRRSARIVALAALAGGSLAYNAALLGADASAAFYLPGPRAWELLFGALLALGAVKPPRGRALRETLGALGLAAIVFSVIFLSADSVALSGASPFAAPLTVFPCLGAVCLILAGGGSGSFASRLLARRAPAACGRISYSLYLWHWPLIVLYNLTIGEPTTMSERAGLILASFVLAAASAHFIERPFRKTPAQGAARPTALPLAGAAMGVSLTLGGVLVAADGFVWRVPEPVRKMASFVHYGEIASMRTGSCFLSSDSNDMKYFSIPDCLARDPARKNVLLIGDSHAADLWSGLRDALPGVNVMQATAAACPPSLDAGLSGSACERLMTFALRDFLPGAKLDAVIVSARWVGRTDGGEDLKRTLAYLKGFTPDVFVVGPALEYDMPLPRLLAVSMLRDDPEMPKRLREPDAFAVEPMIRAAAAESGAHYVSMIEALCHGDDCRTRDDDGASLAFDYGHLTAEGSRYVARRWARTGLFAAIAERAGLDATR